MQIPKMTQEAVHSVDATPDRQYPIRILKTYRANCDCFWEVSGSNVTDAEKAMWEMMNEHQRQRAEILDWAIQILEGHVADPA